MFIPIPIPIPLRGLGALGERLGLACITLTPCKKSSGLGVAMLINGIAGFEGWGLLGDGILYFSSSNGAAGKSN